MTMMSIDETVLNKLIKYKKVGTSYEDIINNLIDFFESHKIENEELI